MKFDKEKLAKWCILNVHNWNGEDYDPIDIINGYNGYCDLKNGKKMSYQDIRNMFLLDEDQELLNDILTKYFKTDNNYYKRFNEDGDYIKLTDLLRDLSRLGVIESYKVDEIIEDLDKIKKGE